MAYALLDHRHRPRGRQRQLHARPSGEADRFRGSRGPRDHGQGEGDGRGVLRQRSEVLVLQRLLTGGRQALTAAQRFPDDFDGIIAGAPAIWASHQSAGQIWIWQATHKDEASYLTPASLRVLHEAVVAQCDALDGVKDGVLEDPTRCTFDPAVVQCKERRVGQLPDAPQVEAARRSTQARRTRAPASGFSRRSIPAARSDGRRRPAQCRSATRPTSKVRRVPGREVGSDDAELRQRHRQSRQGRRPADRDRSGSHEAPRRGKLLMYAGWSDPGIPPGYLPEYYKTCWRRPG